MTYHLEINEPEFTIISEGQDLSDLLANASVWVSIGHSKEVEIPLTEAHIEYIEDWLINASSDYAESRSDSQYDAWVDSQAEGE